MKDWQRNLLHWWVGANQSGLTGGSVAVKAFLGAAGANAAGLPVPAISLQQAAYVFAFAFAVDFFGYLAKNPLPDLPAPPAS